MNRYFGYVRVSTARQGEGVSLTEQREAILRYAARHDLTIGEWFEETETAAKRGRPIFAEALKRLRKGDAEGLVIHKIDRSARNLRDWADLGPFMDEGQIHFAHESLDLNTRGGRLAADIQAVVAADYVRNLSDETKKGQHGRLRQGIYPFRAPLGYRDAGPGKPKTVEPSTGPLIRQVFELYATGEYSLATLSDEMFRRGLRTNGSKRVHKPKLGAILHDAFYTGLMRLPSTGETFQGKHRSLVPRSLFEDVQRRLADKAVKRKVRHDYLFRKLFRCRHCERCLVGERQKGRVYYRCHQAGCPSRSVREDAIGAHVRRLLARLRFDPKEFTWLRQEIDAHRQNQVKEVEAELPALERDIGNVQSRLVRLTTAYVDGDIDRDTFTAAKEAVLAERLRKRERLNELRSNPESTTDRAQRALELAADALQSYDSGTDAHRRELIRTVSSNRTLSGNKLSVELAFPFSELAFSPCVLEGCHSQDDVRTCSPNLPQASGIRGPKKCASILRKLLGWVKEQKAAEKAGEESDLVYQALTERAA
ncbi:MAG: recombinase family protein [Acidobacteria bacterium]|nr:recombinase family protein [Acidobacteriota bacterium]